MAESRQQMRSEHPTRKRGQFSISFLVFTILICSLMLGWWNDRRQLLEQIPTEPKLIPRSYAVQNVDASQVAAKLQELYSGGDEVINAFAPTNSLIVNADQQKHEQIALLLKHLDQATSKRLAKAADETPIRNQ